MTLPLLTASDLSKTFAAPSRRSAPVPVLRGISLSVGPGELVAIVGPSGSGKSTLLYCLAGLESVSGGSVSVLGRNLGGLGRGALARLRRDHVGFVFQSFNLIPSLSARENVALPARLATRTISRADIDAALTEVGLGDRGGHKPGALSGGQQQRVALARVLAMRPDLVFADEPTGSLDSATGAEVLALLRRVASGSRSVVMVTHDLAAAASADRVLVLRDGLIHRELWRPTPELVFEALTSAAIAA
jgi:putative ABC transport system ATP-binding protein